LLQQVSLQQVWLVSPQFRFLVGSPQPGSQSNVVHWSEQPAFIVQQVPSR
jgi:hypothetical protein